jgi:hypothetical protein
MANHQAERQAEASLLSDRLGQGASAGTERALTMVVVPTPGSAVRFMLLTNLSVESAEGTRRVLRYYARRWECEEAIRFLKSEVNLERIRTFNWTAICRLVLLAVLVML